MILDSSISNLNFFLKSNWNNNPCLFLVTEGRKQAPRCPILDIHCGLSVVSVRNPDDFTSNVLLLEELAVSENNCSHQSLCCHSSN